MKRPDWQIALFERARPRLQALTDSALPKLPLDVDNIDEAHIADLTDDEALAMLTNMISREYHEATPGFGKGPQVCGWCVHAAGDTQEAADAAPRMTLDEIREHTATCKHNPLVARIRQLEATLEATRIPSARAPVGMSAAEFNAAVAEVRDSLSAQNIAIDSEAWLAVERDGKLEALHAAWRDMPSSISTSDPGFGEHFQRMLNAVTDLVATPDDLAAVKSDLAKEPTRG